MGVMTPRCQDAAAQMQRDECVQGSLKVSTAKDKSDDEDTNLSKLNVKTSEDTAEEKVPSMEEVLPFHLLAEIINWVKDAQDLSSCIGTSKTMSVAVQEVRAVHLVCRKRYYDLARQKLPFRPPSSNADFEDDETESDYEDSEEEEEEEEEDDDEDDDDEEAEGEEDDTCCGRSEPLLPPPTQSSSQQLTRHISFKSACLNMLQHASKVEQLRLEVDQEMQANPFQKEEIHMVDFWLSEPMFVRNWVSLCCRTLQHLSLIDYGQQAIMRQTPIVRVLSEHCKELRTLELRNMYLDTNDLQVLPRVTSLTLRCIKMTETSLTDICICMPALETLALVSVFGVQEARISSQSMQVLCLGLSTSARVVDLDLPNVIKLQLKMTCPDSLRVRAPRLAYVAVCMEKREGSIVEFENVNNLKELLFGASHFSTLSRLLKSNQFLEKIFLDVPCMALGEDGKWEGVLEQVILRLPDIEALKTSCPQLHTLSVGPGLWHSMEVSYSTKQELATFRRWPALSRLIVHMVVQKLDTCLSLLQWLVEALPSLRLLEIYVHSDSPVKPEHFLSSCREQLMITKLMSGTWKKSLCFACFSF